MYTRRPAALLLIWLLVLAGAHTLAAQSGAGSVQGTVADITGAVIPAAAINVVNVATGVVTETKSNDVGFYQVPGLFTGTYQITITASGMKTYTTSINLLVAQNAVINPVLTAGAVTQRITVAGDVSQLTTPDSGVVSSTLENGRINQLPENGRVLTQLTLMTTPGLESAAAAGQRANGMLAEGLEYRADGVTTTNLHYGGENYSNMQIQDPDSVQEVRIEMTGSGAQNDTPATAVITTKMGTNSLHGTLFETVRNNAIGVAKGRSDPSNFTAPPLIRNEFGASAGGPIILPYLYHGKNKSFWFFSYERFSNVQSNNSEYSVPTMAMRQGDFSGAYNSAGILQTVFDPSTTHDSGSSNCAFTGKPNAYCRTPFPGNQVTSAESPTAKILYDLMPHPTSDANPMVANNLTANVGSVEIIPQVTFRLDHVFNENNRAYLRFSDIDAQMNTSGLKSLAADGIPAGAGLGYQNAPSHTFFTALGYTHIFSPTFFAETIVGQQWFNHAQLIGAASNTNYESMLGLPNNFGEVGFPGISGLIKGFTSSQTDTLTSQIVSNLDENLTKIVGSHQLHFGGRFKHERIADMPQGLADTIGFGGNPTAIYDTTTGNNYGAMSNTGVTDASFYLGSAGNYTVNLEPPHDHYHVNEFDAYIQDDYHVNRNLTLNLGLRYEAHPAVWNKYGLMNSFDLKNDAMVLAVPPSTLIAEGYTTQAIITNDENIGVKFETPQEAGMPAALLKDYNFNFLPRAGFAYQLFGRKYGTVVRGAYGLYQYTQAIENFLNHPQKNNPLIGTYSQSYSGAAQAKDALPNELLRYNDPAVFGVMGVNTSSVVNTSVTNSILPGISLWSDSPDWAPENVTETNLTIEQPLKGNSVLRVSWVWTHTTNLDIIDSYNNHPSTLQWEMTHGAIPPNGGASVIGTPSQNTYAATAMGPYDQTTWSGSTALYTEDGWMNSNQLQANYQRLFHHGVAFQIYYAFSKVLRAGGDTQELPPTSTTVYPYADYPGGMGSAVAIMTSPYGVIGPVKSVPRPPANQPNWALYHDMIKDQLYYVDSSIPFHHIKFNGIVDLPFGRGKRFFGNANRLVDELIGGFQLAGDGNIQSSSVSAPTANWGPVSPIKVYKHKYPIQDCRSGVCYKAFMWYNGYLGPKVTSGVAGSVCTKNCVSGLPASYQPAEIPIDNDPTSPYYGDDEVQITAPNLNSGKPTNIGFDSGPQNTHYFGHQWINGPFNWDADASIFKVFPITERVNLRVNMDAFNVFNVQGYNNPDGSGIEQVQPGVGQASSYNIPRQIQITARLTF